MAEFHIIVNVLTSEDGPKEARLAAHDAFLENRESIWNDICKGNFPRTYESSNKKKFSGAPARTAIRCDFLLACKLALGAKYRSDSIADAAQRDLLFYVLRDRETFPDRNGRKFYCCPKCTSKLYECVSRKVFRYIDNDKWKAAIEADGKDLPFSCEPLRPMGQAGQAHPGVEKAKRPPS